MALFLIINDLFCFGPRPMLHVKCHEITFVVNQHYKTDPLEEAYPLCWEHYTTKLCTNQTSFTWSCYNTRINTHSILEYIIYNNI